jgi:hypothetical protein
LSSNDACSAHALQTDYGATGQVSPGAHSATSTLVDGSAEAQLYANQLEEFSQEQQANEGEDLGSFDVTPALEGS